MLVVFSPIFVADTKIIFRYDFVAPISSFAEVKFLHVSVVDICCVFKNKTAKMYYHQPA